MGVNKKCKKCKHKCKQTDNEVIQHCPYFEAVKERE